jgi:hypothetical protein
MFIVFRGEIIHLARGNDGFYRDRAGTMYALRDDSDTLDIVDRCGIGVLSLPLDHPLTAACVPHDYMTSSPVFMAFYTYKEANEWLESLVLQVENGCYAFWAKPFKWISEIYGRLRPVWKGRMN